MKIPKYKRDRHTFISNLLDITACDEYPISLKRNGYLLSEYYTNDKLIELAKWIKSRRNLLISDNGNFSIMKKIAKKFIKDSETLLDKLKDGLIDIKDAQKQRKELMQKIEAYCQNHLEKQDKESIIKNQLKIKPDYMIALEDLTISVMMICGLFDPEFSPKAEEVSKYQENSRKLYTNQRNGVFGSKEKLDKAHKFHVLHSFDYLSAKNGASYLKELNPDGVAISFGGAMTGHRWITEWKLGDKNIPLGEKLPEMYLAAAAIALGYIKGHPYDTPVHVLGVGSPILIALCGYLFGKSKAVSIDSTAPFKDASQSKIYGSRHAFLKMDMYKVAACALIENKPYTSTTPFFRQFENSFPHNWSKVRAEYGVTSYTNVKELAALIENNREITEKYIPFFAKMRSGDDEMIKHLRVARTGHNYWILHRICESVKDRKENIEKLDKWMEYQVNRYKKAASYKWSKVLEFIHQEAKHRLVK